MAPEIFEDREKALENKFARDEAQHFKMEVKAIELFSRQIALQLGFKGAEADS